MTILESIREMLGTRGIQFREVHHGVTKTSEESAAARGESLSIGGKAILMKVGEEFKLFVLSASRKINSSAIKRQFSERKIRFATSEELQSLTGLVPGSVPPFGRPILPFDIFVDPSIVSNERIAFNAGSLTDSIIMQTKDYLPLAQGTVFAFSISAQESPE